MAGLVTDDQIASLRSIANQALTRPFTISRKTRVENSYGFDETWADVGTGTGWLRMMNKPHTGEQAGHIEGAVAKYRLHSKVGTDIRTGDRISMEGNLYEVHDVNIDDTVRIYCTALLELMQ